jgi:hypothetical protein
LPLLAVEPPPLPPEPALPVAAQAGRVVCTVGLAQSSVPTATLVPAVRRNRRRSTSPSPSMLRRLFVLTAVAFSRLSEPSDRFASTLSDVTMTGHASRRT